MKPSKGQQIVAAFARAGIDLSGWEDHFDAPVVLEEIDPAPRRLAEDELWLEVGGEWNAMGHITNFTVTPRDTSSDLISIGETYRHTRGVQEVDIAFTVQRASRWASEAWMSLGGRYPARFGVAAGVACLDIFICRVEAELSVSGVSFDVNASQASDFRLIHT